MKCVILGGSGFLGRHLMAGLLAENCEVVVFDKKKIQKNEISIFKEIEWIEGDFLNPKNLEHAVKDCDYIFHMVSTTTPKSSNDSPSYDIQTNVIGTLNLLEIVKKKPCKIIFVSSGGAVYGASEESLITELHTTDPICSYGISKLTIEKYLHLYHKLYGLEYCILRLSNPYGEYQALTGVGAVASFLNSAVNNQVIEIWGDGNIIRDYIYVGDVIKAFLNARYVKCEDPVFNIGSGEGRSLNDIVTAIEILLDRPVKYQYLPQRAFDVPVNILDVSKSQQILNWSPSTPFSEGLMRTRDWLCQKQD